jgi:NAD(P)-dependent dehydrogenase (short-subunit alcohol dehydrogenase family)
VTHPSDPGFTPELNPGSAPELEGVRVLVTGGTSGLGFAMGRALAQADLAGTGIDVNLLLPGGATRTGMTPDSAPEELRTTWLDPAIMGPPIRWLASRASDGLTDQRVVATDFAGHGH